ncbi:class F sortase [Streptomyces apocyni]|uniref:class F sortase n=1 Tax=Streptomyces apocyni TaxID=2654677 RepID=UPI0012EA0B70|nr:class F sortase [Streptomyces apocyni]
MADAENRRGSGRLLVGVAWAMLLAGLWLWGREITDLPGGYAGTATGDVAAVGRPHEARLPPAHKPLSAAPPQRLEIPAMGVRAPVVKRGLDADGAIDPPPYAQAAAVGWYGEGVRPGARGTALLVGHVDTQTRPAVFFDLSTLRPGEQIRVTRADGSLAEFTVEEVEVLQRDGFDARRAYGQREEGRAELRLITCGGTFDRATRSYTANVVVSAYLTGKTGQTTQAAQAAATSRGEQG